MSDALKPDVHENGGHTGMEVAIIGMAGKFPGAGSVSEFWKLLTQGTEAITYFSDEELLEAGVDPVLLKDPNYVKSRCIINDEDKFDAYFFDFAPYETELMDPQHRLFLETAWTALEDAGYDGDQYEGLIGLFGGVSMNTYLYSYLSSRKGFISSAEGYQLAIGNDKDFLTTRTSYKLNLKGPSVDVQTACSTSLVAVHIACQNLLNFSCDMAMAGGVSVAIPQKQGYYYQEGMILSPDGHCRAFDEQAGGTISGNGTGIVVLKRLEDAIADGDHIYAVIKGSAFNNDGSNRVGYTAPSVDGQAEVIASAQAVADIDPKTIRYIEAHGTGTVLGDPIEIAALNQVFREHTDEKQFCGIGSVKTNIGHLDAAAGVAGLIKTALTLKHRTIPPSLNFSRPNPKIDMENSAFYVVNSLQEWKSDGMPRRAGVSSFGIGGTNAHVVMEEAPAISKSDSVYPAYLMVMSAKTRSALDTAADNLAEHLNNNPDLNLADVAATLQKGRRAFTQRRMFVAEHLSDAVQVLRSREPKRIMETLHTKDPASAPVTFLFSGQGAQYVGMTYDLYKTIPSFRDSVDTCCDLLEPLLNRDLRRILYPPETDKEKAEEALRQTAFTQPALFILEYALARYWMDLGVEPESMVGHSIGEYVAAHLSGVFSLEDTLKIVAKRGELMQQMPQGSMLSIPMEPSAIDPYLNDETTLAAVNGSNMSVVSGPDAPIKALKEELTGKGIESRLLHTSHAFHSAMMDPVLDTFTGFIRDMEMNEPSIPYLSNVSGTWITNEEATDPAYYAHQLRQTVRFHDNLNVIFSSPDRILLEVGPGKTLSSLASRHPSNTLGRIILNSVRHPQEKINDFKYFLQTVGRLWLSGIPVKWDALYENEKRYRVPLPTYPFERSRYWLDSKPAVQTTSDRDTVRNPSISQWIYTPSWQHHAISIPDTRKRGSGDEGWLLFLDDSSFSHEISNLVTHVNTKAYTVYRGDKPHQAESRTYQIDPSHLDNYFKLFKAFKENDVAFNRILYAWECGHDTTPTDAFQRFLFALQALTSQSAGRAIDMTIVTANNYQVTGRERMKTALAPLIGLSKVVSQEFPHITCRVVDIDLLSGGAESPTADAQSVLTEMTNSDGIKDVAYRNGRRWELHYARLRNLSENGTLSAIAGKTFLLTGGLGNIGLAVTRWLTNSGAKKIILLDTMPFPEPSQWERWQSEHNENPALTDKIKTLQKLSDTATDIEIHNADINDTEALDRIFGQAGKIDGVFHLAGKVGEQSFKALSEITLTDWQSQFAAKVFGVQSLSKVIDKYKPGFCLLQSSLSAVLGGLGFGAYAAANQYMDTFAASKSADTGTEWLSVNWEGWRFGTQPVASGIGSEIAQLALTPDEGIETFKSVLGHTRLNQLIVSTGDLHQRIEKWITPDLSEEEPEAASQAEGSHYARPNLPTPLVEPETELQMAVAGIWKNVLSIDPIGIHDNFFDLGGNSLLGTQLIARLRDHFQIDLPLRSLFEDPTVSGVAGMIESEQKKSDPDTEKVSDMLNQLDQLSEEEISKMLEEKKKRNSDE